ncbi:hypothetical protein LISE100100_00255 [Listeria seeligeri]|uniref:hypothetical protein n=1 Tax=Listeria seeligeri TaxID=1640 RepID=UPI0001C4EC85|nr:hypothetical protein [Listeria seeligeri]CBH27773.1 conserved hypothetical protein [Listeria seeligeri serovar 1/2b str. SLCC3954]
MKESELFFPAKMWIIKNYDCGNMIYAEVLHCDLLALCGPANIIVELKTSLNFKVIEQAIERKKYGHYIYVAVPEAKSISRLATRILRENGIGLLFITERATWCHIPARFNRAPLEKQGRGIRSYIEPFHARETGGVKGGEGNSKYKVMIDGIKKYLKHEKAFSTNGGWVSIREVLEFCEIYYTNPRRQTIQTLRSSWNSGWCEIRVVNRDYELRYREESENG